MLRTILFTLVLLALLTPSPASAQNSRSGKKENAHRIEWAEPQVIKAVERGLDWVARTQSRMGGWSGNNNQYTTAMTSLAGMALLGEGSTTCQGKYAQNIRLAVNFLMNKSRPNGLIGDPHSSDMRYTYGHGYAMLFLSQVLGEEEDAARRKQLVDVLTRAAKFSELAQTRNGGWGYVSAADGNDFDEGSTTITQVQGLRGCRNAGIPVSKDAIDKSIEYIRKCTGPDGGVIYSLKSGGGGRPPITAAAIAALFNAGEYDSELVPKQLAYCKKRLGMLSHSGIGHWQYAHFYYSQVMYRQGGDEWRGYYKIITNRLLNDKQAGQQRDGSWSEGYIGPIYSTAINLIILQLEKGIIPIYQK